MTVERANEIAYTKRICEFCVYRETDEDCMKCDRVKPISSHELHEYHDAVMAALRAQRNSGWISVKDRLPNKNQYVLGYFPAMAGTPSAMQITVGWNMNERSAEGGWGAAHWMPLPEPPKEG